MKHMKHIFYLVNVVVAILIITITIVGCDKVDLEALFDASQNTDLSANLNSGSDESSPSNTNTNTNTDTNTSPRTESYSRGETYTKPDPIPTYYDPGKQIVYTMPSIPTDLIDPSNTLFTRKVDYISVSNQKSVRAHASVLTPSRIKAFYVGGSYYSSGTPPKYLNDGVSANVRYSTLLRAVKNHTPSDVSVETPGILKIVDGEPTSIYDGIKDNKGKDLAGAEEPDMLNFYFVYGNNIGQVSIAKPESTFKVYVPGTPKPENNEGMLERSLKELFGLVDENEGKDFVPRTSGGWNKYYDQDRSHYSYKSYSVNIPQPDECMNDAEWFWWRLNYGFSSSLDMAFGTDIADQRCWDVDPIEETYYYSYFTAHNVLGGGRSLRDYLRPDIDMYPQYGWFKKNMLDPNNKYYFKIPAYPLFYKSATQAAYYTSENSGKYQLVAVEAEVDYFYHESETTIANSSSFEAFTLPGGYTNITIGNTYVHTMTDFSRIYERYSRADNTIGHIGRIEHGLRYKGAPATHDQWFEGDSLDYDEIDIKGTSEKIIVGSGYLYVKTNTRSKVLGGGNGGSRAPYNVGEVSLALFAKSGSNYKHLFAYLDRASKEAMITMRSSIGNVVNRVEVGEINNKYFIYTLAEDNKNLCAVQLERRSSVNYGIELKSCVPNIGGYQSRFQEVYTQKVNNNLYVIVRTPLQIESFLADTEGNLTSIGSVAVNHSPYFVSGTIVDVQGVSMMVTGLADVDYTTVDANNYSNYNLTGLVRVYKIENGVLADSALHEYEFAGMPEYMTSFTRGRSTGVLINSTSTGMYFSQILGGTNLGELHFLHSYTVKAIQPPKIAYPFIFVRTAPTTMKLFKFNVEK